MTDVSTLVICGTFLIAFTMWMLFCGCGVKAKWEFLDLVIGALVALILIGVAALAVVLLGVCG
jgi:hypothetical protein